MNKQIKLILAAALIAIGFIIGFTVAILSRTDNGRYQSLKLILSDFGNHNVVFDTRTGHTQVLPVDMKPQQ